MESKVIEDAVVLLGPELEPFLCKRFEWKDDAIVAIDRIRRVEGIEGAKILISPGFCNGHTHMGDSCFPDGSIGLTLEEGFFRPNGFKYRSLAETNEEEQLRHVAAHLGYMAQSGTICHVDFREQGPAGARLLRRAAEMTGVQSVILSQFEGVPFSEEELSRDEAFLPEAFKEEVRQMLEVADGFSESTMNDLSSVAWRWIRAECEARGKIKAIHCLEDENYRSRSLEIAGKGDLERAIELYNADLIVHMTVANQEEIKRAALSGKTFVLNPRANANLGLPTPPIADLLDSGVNLMLGTDNGMLNSPNMLAELDYSFKLCKSQYGDALRPDPGSILKMATSNAGKFLGGDYLGYLDEGLPASFVAWDFTAPHLRASKHAVASLVSRVTPAECLLTLRLGKTLFSRDATWGKGG
ncbi:MAG: amidohydrolase family protein [Verrucomicrobiota bacterium]